MTTTTIPRMRAPHEKGVIQVEITNACDLHDCSNCTRNLVHHPRKFFVPVADVERALRSLDGYPGVVGIFGGNPCLHPQFAEIAAVFERVRPDRATRGLWTNHPRQHAALIAERFGYVNFNVHGSREAVERMLAGGFCGPVHGREPARHSPVLVAIRDAVGRPGGPPDEAAMWEMISRCDINLRWSGIVTWLPHAPGPDRLRTYFCEVAAGFDLMYEEDCGLPCEPGWWAWPIERYQAQVRRWCPACGIPLRLAGHEDMEFVDDVSRTHADSGRLRERRGRMIVLHEGRFDGPRTHEATDYVGLRRPAAGSSADPRP